MDCPATSIEALRFVDERGLHDAFIVDPEHQQHGDLERPACELQLCTLRRDADGRPVGDARAHDFPHSVVELFHPSAVAASANAVLYDDFQFPLKAAVAAELDHERMWKMKPACESLADHMLEIEVRASASPDAIRRRS